MKLARASRATFTKHAKYSNTWYHRSELHLYRGSPPRSDVYAYHASPTPLEVLPLYVWCLYEMHTRLLLLILILQYVLRKYFHDDTSV